MVATTGVLDRQGVINYVGQNAARFGVDPAAALAVANQEGLNRPPINGVGQSWNLQNEAGFNFGPASFYTGHTAAGETFLNKFGSNSPTIAWTPAGLDYWLGLLGNVSGGLVGGAAISAIVHKFENPRADLAQGEINNAQGDYRSFQQAIQNAGTQPGTTSIPDSSGETTDTGVSTDAGTTATTGVQGQTQAQTQATAGGTTPPGGPLNLGFADSVQHVIFQFLLVFLGIALLLGGIYLLGSRK